jgi:cysteine-S-conjugate beta-lyase
MKKTSSNTASLAAPTRLITAGRDYTEHGFVNPAVYRASTVLFPTAQSLLDYQQDYTYGRKGTPTSRALETAIATVEGGFATKVCSSGLAAVTTSLLAFLKTGDHLLVTDTAYLPTRKFCDGMLKRLGVETTYYDPGLGSAIAGLIRPNTRVIYTESPGSQTMEMQDIPAIAEAAHAKGAIVMIDNTWSAGHYFKAFEHGCDVSIQAATKYFVGHSDAMLGCITCNEATWPQLKDAFEELGQFAGPDDMYLALRGIRTLDVRLERHMKNALEMADWLRGRDEVAEVLYPALPNAPGHTLWKRDFTGASGLFSVVLNTDDFKAAAAMLDGLELFGMGFSWGGFESLCIPFRPYRSASPWTRKGVCLRFHIGLESPDDLKADLAAGFARLNAASA